MKRIELQKLIDDLHKGTPERFLRVSPLCRGERQNLPPQTYYALSEEHKQAIQIEILDGTSSSLLLVDENQLVLVEKLNDTLGYQMRTAAIPEEVITGALAVATRSKAEFPMPTKHMMMSAAALLVLVLLVSFFLLATASTTGTDKSSQPAVVKNTPKPGAGSPMPNDATKLLEEAEDLSTRLEKMRDEMTRMRNEHNEMKTRLKSTKDAAEKAEGILIKAKDDIVALLDKTQKNVDKLDKKCSSAETSLKESTATFEAAKGLVDSGRLKSDVKNILNEEMPNWRVTIPFSTGTFSYSLERKKK